VTLFAGATGDAAPREPGLVPDLLPLCLSSGLGWRVPRPPLAVLAFMGFEWRFVEPVRIGDTIHSVSRTLTKRSMREGGVVIEERRIVNQRGETVQSGKLTLLVARRPVA
jgi:acyl dehydratase